MTLEPKEKWEELLEPFVKKWEEQGRSENEKWAVRNFLTGQGGIGIASLLSTARQEASKSKWSEDGRVYHCSDGDHNSWWESIRKTPEWEAWYEHASKNMLYDVDECEECGCMSEEHAKDFFSFIRQEAREQALREAEKEKLELYEALQMMWDQYCPEPYTHACMSAGENCEEVLGKYIISQIPPLCA